ncbi:MAG: bifunctional nuclease family protein [Odoribacter sp.]|nr:bifunctional nuclease family protein [Odoribacter sp.]
MERVKLKVLGLSYSMSQAGAYALILADEEDEYRIPIIIGVSEAQSIAIQMENMKPQRPMTHDLIKLLAGAVKYTLEEVFINHLENGVFYAQLLFGNETGRLLLDSRTSDAIALALRYDCPIYSLREIVKQAGIPVDREEEDTEIAEQETLKDKNTTVSVFTQYSEQELRHLLNEAITNEEYEKASQIRDVLRSKPK